ncbi:MerR family transcriptional regulator [Komagataeibacter swingsii]|uniref:Transcriptional regulator n=1 Tax=Komagataeibacter swingsii TaxID=215220 RepID=A0A2V4RH62_9PROT|nr:MerR family transcriptional regulator [Komagataeibacter swingsii]PYD71356.1 transcriptional regulator [Komagataeibacter swingsii]GBQ63004.1 transcriptional regulator [Komagataeibacter swingsii DSM 16373]
MSTQRDPDGTAAPAHDMTQSGMDGLPIYEVARELGLAQHVMRMWESRFPQLQPVRGQVGRRYYRPQDIAVLRQIADLLYVRKLSIAQAQAELGRMTLAAGPSPAGMATPATPEIPAVPTVIPDAVVDPAAPVAQAQAAADGPAHAPAPEHVQPVETATVIEQVTIIEETTIQAADTAPAEPTAPLPVQPVAKEAPAPAATVPEAATPPEGGKGDEAEIPLEQLVMIELERLQAENTVLRDSLRGVLVELQALRDMVPV